jgi:hypothetical protein
MHKCRTRLARFGRIVAHSEVIVEPTIHRARSSLEAVRLAFRAAPGVPSFRHRVCRLAFLRADEAVAPARVVRGDIDDLSPLKQSVTSLDLCSKESSISIVRGVNRDPNSLLSYLTNLHIWILRPKLSPKMMLPFESTASVWALPISPAWEPGRPKLDRACPVPRSRIRMSESPHAPTYINF